MKACLLCLMLVPLLGKAQIITTIAGTGVAGFSGDGGSAVTAQFNWPTVVRFDHVGNMYIPDWKNNVVRKINTSGIITTVVGNISTSSIGGYAGDGGLATAAELNGPVDVAFDAASNMYITDQGAVVRKVNTSGIITTFVGTGSQGYNGDGIPATAAELNSPAGLVFDASGNLYIGDESNSRIRKINTSGIITTIAGNGMHGYNGDGIPATAAELREPCLLAISSSGDVYITDRGECRVRMINSSGIITTAAGNGTLADTGDGGSATSASISECVGITFDAAGNYYISNDEICSIRKINTFGIITTVVGNDTCGYSGDGGLATAAQISAEAICSAVDALGNLYIADYENSRIRKVTYDTATINKVNEINKTPQNVTIYPNPATNIVTIKAPPGLPQREEIQSVEILNLIGQEVYKQSYSNINNAEIPINNYANGIYFVKVNGVYAGKFVKE